VVDGDIQPVPEEEETRFAGWRRSQPVVTGWTDRLDAGLFGAVVACVGASTRGTADTGPLSAARPALGAEADWASDHWGQPDAGIWQATGHQRRYCASLLDAWAGFDGLARIARSTNPLDLEAVGWHQDARAVLGRLESDFVAPDGGLRAFPDSDEADAALLRVAWQGPWPLAHPVVPSTVNRVLERLGSGPFLYRYSDRFGDGRAGPDNPDLTATLWAVKALARLGRWEEAHERIEAVIAAGGPLGLLGECADSTSGELLGNYPTAATHLALVDAALALEAGPS
jgi:GH15 family glucan-1,4-alpha-glucosidase